MNITETWLNKDISNDEASITDYKIFRGDRNEKIKQGGTAIYLLQTLEAEQISSISHNKCEMVAIKIPNIQTINIVLYRPPDTNSNDFNIILDNIQEIFKELKAPEPTIILSGDFNFPFVKWKRMQNGGCTSEYRKNTNATTDEKLQFEKLMNICKNQCMIQVIEEPTRGENTLDLMFTNEPNMVTAVDVNKTGTSDHSRVEVSTNYIINEQLKSNREMEDPNSELRKLNFRAEEKIDWENIKESIKNIEWKKILEKRDTIEITNEFISKISNICIENIPKKNKEVKERKIPRATKKLINRIKMLKRDKQKAKSIEKKKEIENKISETEAELIQQRRKMKLESEKKAIECMKDNPKMFYSLINKNKNKKN